MRRQAKPFVTEYKASARRNKAGAAPQPEMDFEPATPEAARAKGSRGNWAAPDDAGGGYNAAFAAADALFAPRAPSVAAKASAAAEATTDAAPGASAAARATQLLTDRPGSSGSGRILQALETAEPDVAAAEAQGTPASRGRGAGTTRKPRRTSVAETSTSAVAGEPAAIARIAATSATAAREFILEPPASASSGAEPAIAATASDPGAIRTASAEQGKRRRERFPWIRTKLRPGEQWKRRLPKVAW